MIDWCRVQCYLVDDNLEGKKVGNVERQSRKENVCG